MKGPGHRVGPGGLGWCGGSWQQPIIVVCDTARTVNLSLNGAVGKRLIVVRWFLERANAFAAVLHFDVHPDARFSEQPLAAMWARQLGWLAVSTAPFSHRRAPWLSGKQCESVMCGALLVLKPCAGVSAFQSPWIAIGLVS